MRRETAEKKCYELWRLLDDIDTLDDACKDNNESFRELTHIIQQKRWLIMNVKEVDKLFKKFDDGYSPFFYQP